MVKRLLFFTLALIFFQISEAFSQIAIGTVDPGPYTPGSSIAATFNLGTDCIKPGNRFNLFLVRPDGTEIPTPIGFYDGFYSTFVNGTIPAGTPLGVGYKLRVKSTTPALTSNDSDPFDIVTGGPVIAGVTSFPVLALDQAGKAEVFGYCPGRDHAEFNFSDASTALSTVTGTIKNEITGANEAPLVFASAPPDPSFDARLGHYTVFITAKLNGTVGTRAYLIVNNNINNSFGTTGNNIVCLPGGYLQYSVDLRDVGIKNNFPGTTYEIKWGDGNGAPEVLTICDLAAGYIRHEYTRSSCGQPVYNTGNGNQYNVFGINISAVSPFCPGAGAGLSTFVRVLTKPENRFNSPIAACTGSTVNFTNTSVAGQSEANTPNCVDNDMRYNWFVDDVRVAVNQPKSYVLPYRFTTAGTHTIRLESVTPGACNGAPITKEICIQDPPQPAFDFNNQPQTGCAPFSIQAFDRSIIDSRCNADNAYNWIVTGPTGVQFDRTAKNPVFTFNNPGIYEIILEIQTASCGTVRTQIPQKIILADGAPTATLSADAILCGLGTFNFNESTTGPTKTLLTGTQQAIPNYTYTWTVTESDGTALAPGDYSFEGGTDAQTRYPIIKFNSYKTYRIKVVHVNTCGQTEDTQLITFLESPVPSITVNPEPVCYNANINLTGSVSNNNYVGVTWTTLPGGGTFTSNGTLTSTYIPSAADRAALKATVILTLNTGLTGSCEFVSVIKEIAIYPNNTGTSSTSIICSDDRATLTPTSTVPGSTFTWSAANLDGNASGFTATGNGAIDEVLTNNSPTQNAVVVYTITPTANGCAGVPFTFTVTITPRPVISTPLLEKTICQNNPAAIILTSNIPTRFTWTSTASLGITGNTNNSVGTVLSTTTTINDLLLNNTLSQGTVTYTITPYSGTNCTGTPIVVVVKVDPAVTIANAGTDDSICETTSYTLKGNEAKVGSGLWTILSTHSVTPTFDDPTKYDATVSELVSGQTYEFQWTITGTGACPETSARVTISVTPRPVITTPVLEKIICQDNPAAVVLTSNIPTRFTWTSVPSAGITGNTNNSVGTVLSTTTTINDVLLNNTLSQGTVTYTITPYSGTNCTGDPIIVTVKVDPAVTVANAGADDSICETSTYKLKGNEAEVGTGLWTILSTHAVTPTFDDPTKHDATVSGLVSGQTYEFQWTITGTGQCPGTDARVKISVTPRPVITTPVLEKTICQNNPAAITLTSNIPTRFTWTSVASPGITGNTSSTGATLSTTATITDALLNPTFTQGIVTYTIKSFSGTDCEGNTIIVVVKVDPSVTTANAGPDANICDIDSYNLKGNKPDVGTGLWTLVSATSGTPLITVPTDFETTVTGLVAGATYKFKWTITGPGTGACSTSEDEVTIVVNIPTVPGIATGAQTVCQNLNTGIITLSGNTGTVLGWQSSPDGPAVWTDIPGNNTGTTYTFNNLTVTTQFRAIVQNLGCATAYSTPTTIIVAPATTIASVGPDQTLCNEIEVTLKGNPTAAGETGLWTRVSGNVNAVITDPTNSETKVTGLDNGATYVFRWTITGNSPCGPTHADVTIRNNAPINQNITSTTAVVCNGQTVSITGSTPTGGAENGQYVYVWQSKTNSGAWTTLTGETGKDLTITLTTTGDISFRRIVTSGECTSTSNEYPITVQPPISGNIISANQTICEGTSPAIMTGSTLAGGSGNFLYKWQSSPDGATWTDIPAALQATYQAPALTATTFYRRIVSTLECAGTLQSISNTVKKTVSPNAKAEFNWVNDNGCVPFTLDITAVPYPDRNATYTWFANATQIGTGITFPGYIIQNSNTRINIKLVVTSSLGCDPAEFSHDFTTNSAVPASFTQSKTEGCGPLPIIFVNTSPQTPGATFKWDFGNGESSTAVNPPPVTFQPDPTGKDITYTVTLTASTICGDETFTSEVLVKSAPRPIFSPSTTNGCSPLAVSFNNNSPLQTGTKYIFDFKDGTPPKETTDRSTVTHTYTTTTNTQIFYPTLTAINECGNVTTDPYEIVVKPKTVFAELVVNGTQLTGCAPFTVTFDNNSTGATGFSVDFKDGTTPRQSIISPERFTHPFTEPGVYEVTLTATNGCSTDTKTVTITVLAQPVAAFEADNTLGCPGLVVKFKNNTQNGISYVWDFGDGSATSDEFEPTHTYTGNQEFYTVTLTATNNLGCPMTISKPQFIHIVQPPTAAFNVLPSTMISIPDYTFNFEDKSTNNPTIWEWNFGDKTGGSRSKNPSHTYLDTGRYKVTLKVINQNGCFDTTFKYVTIKGVPGYLYVPNSFIPGDTRPELREFRAKGSGIQSWRFSIFNKWGQILWESTKLDEGRPAEGWDGNFKGQPLPQGVYYWKIDVKMVNGTEWKGMTYDKSPPKRTGAIHLIR